MPDHDLPLLLMEYSDSDSIPATVRELLGEPPDGERDGFWMSEPFKLPSATSGDSLYVGEGQGGFVVKGSSGGKQNTKVRLGIRVPHAHHRRLVAMVCEADGTNQRWCVADPTEHPVDHFRVHVFNTSGDEVNGKVYWSVVFQNEHEELDRSVHVAIAFKRPAA